MVNPSTVWVSPCCRQGWEQISALWRKGKGEMEEMELGEAAPGG